MDFLAGMNPQQQEAVLATDGPLLILAGAGSGKTRVITHRMGYTLQTKDVHPRAILAVTFTNKAAKEMRERVSKLLQTESVDRLPQVSTFHSFCVRTLRRDGANLAQIRPNFTPQFVIYDDGDQTSVIKQSFRNLGLDEKFMKYSAALSRISQAKCAHETPADFYKMTQDPKMGKLAVVFEQYEAKLRQANALDFDDLLLETVRLLQIDKPLVERYNEWIQYLMIDEYQDTNRNQYELMRLLSMRHRNVCVVGDEDQSIYSWRGADIRNILDFEVDFPEARTIRLEQNYRSTKNILEAASAVVARNTQRKGKTLWTDSGAGEKITIFEALDGDHEALHVAQQIDKAITKDPETKVAVLYRTNFQSRQMEEALRRTNVRYVVVGGLSFYQRAEVKDMMAYLRAVTNPEDSVNLLRVINTPARGIGKTTLDQIEQYATHTGVSVWRAISEQCESHTLGSRAETALKHFISIMEECRQVADLGDVQETLEKIVNATGYKRMLEEDISLEAKNRLENIHELLNAAGDAVDRGETLVDFIDQAALVAQTDGLDSEARVSLLTIHNAKGLEFPIVFVVGMEDGLFPHSRSLEDPNAMEEERRLCYVAMTRAEKQLTLSWARFRRRFGGGPQEATMPSRFLLEVPGTLSVKKGAGRPTQTFEEDESDVDLFAEQAEVREAVKKNLYNGKTYNSVENISRYFSDRGMPMPTAASRKAEAEKKFAEEMAQAELSFQEQAPPPQQPSRNYPSSPAFPQGRPTPPWQRQNTPAAPRPTYVAPTAASAPNSSHSSGLSRPGMTPAPPGRTSKTKKGDYRGATVNHSKYGRGTVLLQEGDGEDAKLTISFPGTGLKKIIAKYAGLNLEE